MVEEWLPDPIWAGEPCYVIGGGPSLEGFDWDCLRGRNVVGCNAAFYMGASLVPIMVFGDAQFLKQHRTGLDQYAEEGGWVVTCSHNLKRFPPPGYLKQMRKQIKGLAADGLGWNRNTGSAAVNLALLLGATTVYLLGYDMQLSGDGRKNFHNAYSDTPNPQAYERFLRGFDCVVRDLKQLFPGQRVVNLEDGTSLLEAFPKESLRDHLALLKECMA